MVKAVPRRRGARRDCDRVCKSEDVNGYKGSMPVDEVLAYVQGEVHLPSSCFEAESRSRRPKRKDLVSNMQRAQKGILPRSDIEYIQSDVDKSTTEQIETFHDVIEPVDCRQSNGKALSLNMNNSGKLKKHSWLTSNFPAALSSSDAQPKKEQEFVLVRNKKKQKSPTTSSTVDDREDIGKCSKICSDSNGLVHHIPSSVSRNSSELSFTPSVDSDIDGLSHFIEESGVHEAAELLDDAHVDCIYWYDAREDSPSCRSSNSSYDSMRRFECMQRDNLPYSSSSVDIEHNDDSEVDFAVRGVPDGVEEVSDFESPQLSDTVQVKTVDYVHDNKVIHKDKTTDFVYIPNQLLSDAQKTTHLMCHLVSDKQRAVPAGQCNVNVSRSHPPVEFVDSVALLDRSIAKTCLSGITFTFGCMVSEHLTDGGLCTQSACSKISLFSKDECITESFPSRLSETQLEPATSLVGFTIERTESEAGTVLIFGGLLPEDVKICSESPSFETGEQHLIETVKAATAHSCQSLFGLDEARKFLYTGC
jgi:hypothetical protein